MTQQQVLSLLNFLSDEVRILDTPEERWFLAKNVAEILGIANSRDMT